MHVLLQVLNQCKHLLLQIATPDALVRLRQTPLVQEQEELCEIFEKKQLHSSLAKFVEHQFSLRSVGCRIQVNNCIVTEHHHIPNAKC